MIELFYGKGACSMAPHILLCEANIPHKITAVPLDGTQKKPEFLAINPKGSVPAIRLQDGAVLTEASLILQYLADQVPAQKLFPAQGTTERYRAQEWMNFIATELHKGIGVFFAVARMTNEQSKKDAREMFEKKLAFNLNFLAQHLAKNEYILGSQFTAPDAYAFTTLCWLKPMNIDMAPYPSILAFMERMRGRPAVQRAMKEEGLI